MKNLKYIILAISLLVTSLSLPRRSEAIVGIATGITAITVISVAAVMVTGIAGICVAKSLGPTSGSTANSDGCYPEHIWDNDVFIEAIVYTGLSSVLVVPAGIIMLDKKTPLDTQFAQLNAKSGAALGVSPQEIADYNQEITEVNVFAQSAIKKIMKESKANKKVNLKRLKARADKMWKTACGAQLSQATCEVVQKIRNQK